MYKDSFREIALAQAPTQEKEIDALLEEAPFLAIIPYIPASNGLQHVWEELEYVEGAQVIDFDGEYPKVDATGSLDFTDLVKLGGIMTVGVDKAKKMGGHVAYFSKKSQPVIKKSGAEKETSLIYNTLIPYAKANGNEQSALGSANKNSSMVCVKLSAQEMCGLYDPTGFGDGKVFEIKLLNGGNEHLIDVTTVDENGDTVTKQTDGFAATLKSYTGFLAANKRNVATIRNIDVEEGPTETGYVNLPSKPQMNKMVRTVRANGANTVIVTTPSVIDALSDAYASSITRMVMGEGDYRVELMAWRGIPFLATYNMKDATEANV